MKWTDQQIEKLKELCYEGKSNKDIASILRCKVTDVYNKRSKLGITIDKCKTPASLVKEEPKSPGLNKVVKTIFNRLYDELLLLIASDYVSDFRAEKYSDLCAELMGLEEKYEKLLKED